MFFYLMEFINYYLLSFFKANRLNSMNKNKQKQEYSFIPFHIENVKPVPGKGLHAPLARSGHRMICIGSHLYVFGGYNPFISQHEYDDDVWRENCPLFKELWKFNIISKKWIRMKNKLGMPNELASHAALACNPYMIVYGGTATPFGESSSSSVHLCHLSSNEWTELETKGQSPSPMYGQAVCRHKDDFYVVGGTTGFHYCLDVHVLNLKTLEWKYLLPSIYWLEALPDSRYRHEIIFFNNCIFVFGGGTSEGAFSLKSLPTYNVDTGHWNSTQTLPDLSTGQFPKSRKCHVLVRYKHYVFIQGGTNETERLSDFWRLDLWTMRWQKLTISTDKPIYFHSAAVTEDGAMYIFGGIWQTESSRTNKIFKVHLDIPSLLTMAWQAVDFYAPNLSKLPYSELLAIGIPPLIAESLKPDIEIR